jgi:hypothetical protein
MTLVIVASRTPILYRIRFIFAIFVVFINFISYTQEKTTFTTIAGKVGIGSVFVPAGTQRGGCGCNMYIDRANKTTSHRLNRYFKPTGVDIQSIIYNTISY